MSVIYFGTAVKGWHPCSKKNRRIYRETTAVDSMADISEYHCVKSVRIGSYSGPHFPGPNVGKYEPE